MPADRYEPQEIEPRWQRIWSAERTWKHSTSADLAARMTPISLAVRADLDYRRFTERDGILSHSEWSSTTPHTSLARIVDRYGADTARCMVLFAGERNEDGDWCEGDAQAHYRFLGRVWRMAGRAGSSATPRGCAGRLPDQITGAEDDLLLLRRVHLSIAAATTELILGHYHIVLATLMELTNACSRRFDAVEPDTLCFAVATATLLLFPVAPHTAADAFDSLGNGRAWEQPWPQADATLLGRDVIDVRT